MNILNNLKEIGLNTDNSVVIGSGILSALGIRYSNDIDVVVDMERYDILSKNARFGKTKNHGNEILADVVFEIGTSWDVLGKKQSFNDLYTHSVIIGGVRYITIDFLLKVKESWLKEVDVRQKDINDVAIIKEYLSKRVAL